MKLGATRPGIVALVGLPGSGKSTVAPLLARRLGWAAADIDDRVEAQAGAAVPDIFTARGEPAFRRLEREALDDVLAAGPPVVIACGGGLAVQPGIADRLLANCAVIWLDAIDAELLARLARGAPRPLLQGDASARLAELRAAREPVYARAHAWVRTDGRSPDQVAAAIASALDRTVRISLGVRSHPVLVAGGAVDDVVRVLPPLARRVVVIADRSVVVAARAVAARIRRAGRSCSVLAVSGGERLKTWASAGRLLERLAGMGIERGDCLVAMGGGSVTDVGGFLAATYHRGIAWVAVPTTLLGMVDSGIGGKTGVNLKLGKNLAGSIWQPRAVICDVSLLASLPERPFRSGFAEIVKYSMVGADDLIPILDTSLDRLLARDLDSVAEVVRLSVSAKAAVVAADEHDSGVRAILNYGHTVGHAVEAVTGFGAVDHGEAVALGMRVAGALSHAVLGCPVEDITAQNNLLDRCGFVTPRLDVDAVGARLAHDKKAVAGRPHWVLLERRGTPRFGLEVLPGLVRNELEAIIGSRSDQPSKETRR